MKKDCMMFKNYNANWLFADRVFRLVYIIIRTTVLKHT